MDIHWDQIFTPDLQTWLLAKDADNPGVRYFTLTDLLGLPQDAPDVQSARTDVMSLGPVPAILAAQHPDGYWIKPGYYPKYNGTFWTLVMLAMLGADGENPQLRKAGDYVLNHDRCRYGRFTAGGMSGLIHCLEGNLIYALIRLGWLGDPRLDEAIEWLARSANGDGIASSEEKNAPIRYYRSGNCAPGFVCTANNYKPCAWGAVKVLYGLGSIPKESRKPAEQKAVQMGIDFLLGIDPSTADYPTMFNDKPNRSWFKFGFPVFYITDVLQILEAMALLELAPDPRLENALSLLLSKRDAGGRWKMEYTYNGKTWVDVEIKGQPSKWVTLRALRVLKAASQ